MKKISLVTLTLLVSISMLSPLTTLAESNTPAEASVQSPTNDVEKKYEIEKFSEMQDKITGVLTIEDGKYVYDEREVKAIVDEFDFEELSIKTGIDFTSESFLQDALENIKNTKFENPIQSRNANRYNRNYYEEGWNYGRMWMDTAKTNWKIKDLQDGADYVAAGGLLIDLFSGAAGLAGFLSGPGAGALMLGATVAGGGVVLYFQNMARNLEYKNNGTGTVLEVNKFIAIYSCWSQNEYKGK